MAQQIFVNQTDLKINVDVQATIAGSTIQKLKYRKPDATEGEVDLTIVDDSIGLLEWQSPSDTSIFDIPGTWTFWAYIEFPTGASINGSPDSVFISKIGYY